ncbi:FlgO family outer membrane protein [Paraferrimonas sp. SM1919]|uniref:FlgO family outer membrane protein n=1 Tax=Paraferrimonas sp. SM1919 TaxID=2662263 RepID=UPI001F08FB1B|nr:FlgO family outer membrane protein [Paraferrimonas sp. SM1919]
MSELVKLDIQDTDNQVVAREQLNRVLESQAFVQSPKMKELLNFVVEQAIMGNGDRLKQFTIATEVFERGVEFDHQSDPIVRIQAGRVRRALETYYLTEGVNDQILISIPKGKYCPLFQSRPQAAEVNSKEQPTPEEQPFVGLSPTLTVIPFLSLSDDKEQHYFAEGFGEDLATELSRFDTLKVVSMYALGDVEINPTSTTDIKRLGQELNVSFVTSGTLRTYQDKARIQARLYRTDTGQQVWAERYDCDLTTGDLFDIQDQIIAEIVAELASSFGIIHRQLYLSSNHKSVEQLTTYEATLRYRHYLMTLSKETFHRAVEALEHATVKEPNFTMAWAMLAILYFDAERLHNVYIADSIQKGIDCARRAVEMDPTNQEAQMALLLGYQSRGDAQGVKDTADKVVSLNPNAAYQIGLAGWALALAGDFERGMQLLDDSKVLNPYRPAWFSMAYILEHYMNSDYSKALKELDQFSLMQLYWHPLLKAVIEVEMGDIEAAKVSYQQIIASCSDFESTKEQRISSYVSSPEIQQKLLASLAKIA